LRDEDFPCLRGSGPCQSVWGKRRLHVREVFGQQGSQITIFSEVQQVLLVERVDFVVGVFLDEIRVDDVWFALIFPALERFDSIQREATGQTSDGAEQTFEGFCQSMTYIILVHLKLKRRAMRRTYLNHCPPRSFFVLEARFATDTDDFTVIGAARN